jgi:hypothetical protein
MTLKKYPSGNWGTQSKDLNHGNDILARRDRLTKSLRDAFNAGLIPASWVAEIAKIGGCHV